MDLRPVRNQDGNVIGVNHNERMIVGGILVLVIGFVQLFHPFIRRIIFINDVPEQFEEDG
jgi:hypothetical protein